MINDSDSHKKCAIKENDSAETLSFKTRIRLIGIAYLVIITVITIAVNP